MTGNVSRQRGDYFERQTRGALEAAGWVVIRSAGSFGPADLVALRRNSMGAPHALLISCKLNGTASAKERAALVEVADRTAAEALLAHRPSRGTIELVTIEDRRVRATLKVPTRPKHRAEVEADAEAPPQP